MSSPSSETAPAGLALPAPTASDARGSPLEHRRRRPIADRPLQHAVAVIAMALGLAILSVLPADTAGADDAAGPGFAIRVLAEVNRVRLTAGVSALTLDDRLARAAQAHCDDMAANDFAGHGGSDGSLAPTRGRRAGYPVRLIGENLQMGHTTPEDVVAAWMASPSHRENLLRPEVVHAGVGHVFLPADSGHARYGHYWSLVVAAPSP